MYFLKFMKWFWVVYLDDTFERLIAALLTWAFFAIVISITGGIMGSDLIIIWFIRISFALVMFSIFMAGILYMRTRYFEWQRTVFDKLKE